MAINTTTGATRVFDTLCSNLSGTAVINPNSCAKSDSGMWSRAGIVVDPDPSMGNRIYGGTGNGDYNPSNHDYGDSVLALSTDGSTLLDDFTPSNYASLQNSDLDQGSSSPAMIPRQNGATFPLVMVQGGKEGIFRVIDRTNLGGAGAVLQSISFSSEIKSAPAVYTSAGTTYVYLGLPDGVHAFRVTISSGTPQLTSIWTSTDSQGGTGTSPVVRGNVVYAAAQNQLVAYDATTGAKLGSSNLLGGVHWQSPVVTGGVVYCSDTGGNLTAWTIGP
ncbi:MAG: PQQ-binding-like beta-propeller repeat protein [Mycobacteriaceae bacterium]|nr:PQQ-binding-like beta-propeller repeat protein [Mycobacteriaceae bacterium]